MARRSFHKSMAPAAKRSSDSQDWSIVVVQRPSGWVPSFEFDMPQKAAVLEIIDDKISDPATFVRQYNAVSMKETGATWAAVAHGLPKPGAEIRRQSTVAFCKRSSRPLRLQKSPNVSPSLRNNLK